MKEKEDVKISSFLYYGPFVYYKIYIEYIFLQLPQKCEEDSINY